MKPIRIFIVDDEDRVRSSVTTFLTEFSEFHVVGQASGGLEAISGFQKVSPDIILMDVSMPGMSGFEATKRIRAIDPGTKIIIVSSMAGAQYHQACRDAGALDAVTKDNLSRDLAPAIRRAAAS